MREERMTLYELWIGIALFALIFMLGNIFVSNHLAYTLGVLLGGVIAGIMTMHMYAVLNEAVLYDKETASKKVKRGSLLRTLMMLAGLAAAAIFPKVFSFVGVVLGITGLKFSAYLQPLTHKVFIKFFNKGR